MQEKKLNPELDIFVEQDQLSTTKINELLFLKKFIDRVSKKPFIDEQKLEEIKNKLGTVPDIITWGDYFQTEVATEHWQKKDNEFSQVIQTIIYDIIVSAMIFYRKNENSMEEFKKSQWLSQDDSFNEPFESREELEHFNILLVYYEEMGLDLSQLQKEDFTFFSRFVLDEQAS